MLKKKFNNKGFAGMEIILIILAIIVIGGVGYLVISNQSSKNTSLNNITSNTQGSSTSSISQLTSNDEQADKSADNSGDNQVVNSFNNASTSITNVGSSYNENSY